MQPDYTLALVGPGQAEKNINYSLKLKIVAWLTKISTACAPSSLLENVKTVYIIITPSEQTSSKATPRFQKILKLAHFFNEKKFADVVAIKFLSWFFAEGTTKNAKCMKAIEFLFSFSDWVGVLNILHFFNFNIFSNFSQKNFFAAGGRLLNKQLEYYAGSHILRVAFVHKKRSSQRT